MFTDSQSVWINSGKGAGDRLNPLPGQIFRRVITLGDSPLWAGIAICGVGFYELTVNGQKIGSGLLTPPPSDYRKHLYFDYHEITAQLNRGENCLTVMLGRGRYAMDTVSVWGWEHAPWFAEPRFILSGSITYRDGSSEAIQSDEVWKCCCGPIVRDSLLGGEVYDARLEPEGWRKSDFDDSDWDYTCRADSPGGTLVENQVEPIQVIRDISALRLVSAAGGSALVDFGELISGWVRITVQGAAGTRIDLKYGERLNSDGTLCDRQEHVEGPFQQDTYILKGGQVEVWEPRFSYKGFRYVEITGWPANHPLLPGLTARVIHNQVERTGRFSCSEPLINAIGAATVRAVENNLHNIPTDTPMYEKNGWTGDAQLIAETGMYLFDLQKFFERWLQDIADAQTDTGELPPIIPSPGWGMTSGFGPLQGILPAWDAALFQLPLELSRFYDSKALIRMIGPGLRYLRYLERHAQEGIIHEGLGDWMPPAGNPQGTELLVFPPEKAALSSTAWFYRMIEILLHMLAAVTADGSTAEAERLERPSPAELAAETAYWTGRRSMVFTAFNRAFYDTRKGWYRTSGCDGEYRQTSNILPLQFGLVPMQEQARVVAGLVADLRRREWHLNTGILGTRYLLPVLTEHGYVDTAYAVATRTSYPSWGFWLEQGIGSLPEAWELNARSHNHFMFGTVTGWLYSCLAGIVPGAPGFRQVFIRPFFPERLKSVQAQLQTRQGIISVHWKQTAALIRLEWTVPEGLCCRFHNTLTGAVEQLGSGTFLRKFSRRRTATEGKGAEYV